MKSGAVWIRGYEAALAIVERDSQRAATKTHRIKLARFIARAKDKYDHWSRKIEIRSPIRVRSTLEVYQMIALHEWNRKR
jgi:chorismate mutase